MDLFYTSVLDSGIIQLTVNDVTLQKEKLPLPFLSSYRLTLEDLEESTVARSPFSYLCDWKANEPSECFIRDSVNCKLNLELLGNQDRHMPVKSIGFTNIPLQSIVLDHENKRIDNETFSLYPSISDENESVNDDTDSTGRTDAPIGHIRLSISYVPIPFLLRKESRGKGSGKTLFVFLISKFSN